MLEITLSEFTNALGSMHSVYSADWSTGGYFCCCWDEYDHPIPEEDEPDHPSYLEEELQRLFGDNFDINSLQLVYSDDTYTESDWYGGCATYATKYISVADVYSALIATNQLKIVD